ncbi:MAG: hypothetical protein ACE37F_00625 [Nannocystaceae bacterium]|nr:hypothetical protein [bacterium]
MSAAMLMQTLTVESNTNLPTSTPTAETAPTPSGPYPRRERARHVLRFTLGDLEALTLADPEHEGRAA